tara:strand:+ start:402 stop:596 length:195 start_codon:yes stop_codon:yes gene_type:complete
MKATEIHIIEIQKPEIGWNIRMRKNERRVASPLMTRYAVLAIETFVEANNMAVKGVEGSSVKNA